MLMPFEQWQPSLGKQVYIHPQATVIGQVVLGEDVSVWPAASIRGDIHHIHIGARSNIQDGCILHVTHDGPYQPGGFPLIIGEDVTVGHQAVLHGCTIESLSLIGMASIILDGAIVESEVMVGAGSLVPPGKRLFKGFLWMGSPVKQIRPLKDEERNFLKYSAEKYVELKNRYLTAIR